MTFEEHYSAIARARDAFNAAVDAAQKDGVSVDFHVWSDRSGKRADTTKVGVIRLFKSMG